MCNSFFVDLVSTMCFKDNSPPQKEVVKDLLSLLFVEKAPQREWLCFHRVKNSVLHLFFYVWCEQWSTFLFLVLGCCEHTKSLSPFDDVVDKTPVIRSVVLKLLLKYRWAPRTWSCLRNTLTSLFFFSSWLFLCHKAFFAELVASSLSGKASLARDALVPLSVWTVSLAYSHAGHEFIMATSTWRGRRRQIWGKGTEHCEMCGYRKWGVRNLQFSS